MVDIAQWSAPSLEQALEIARGELPREFRSWDEVPGSSAVLPTPRTNARTGPSDHGDGGPDLQTAIALLPTPVSMDAHGARNETSGRQEGSQHHAGTTLGDVAHLDQWGKFADAIARWETVLGRPAPPPTEPTGKHGRHRLSPAFVEWMMGLPSGHVTDVPGLSYVAQLKALGNGVVPQQAALATATLVAA